MSIVRKKKMVASLRYSKNMIKTSLRTSKSGKINLQLGIITAAYVRVGRMTRVTRNTNSLKVQGFRKRIIMNLSMR